MSSSEELRPDIATGMTMSDQLARHARTIPDRVAFGLGDVRRSYARVRRASEPAGQCAAGSRGGARRPGRRARLQHARVRRDLLRHRPAGRDLRSDQLPAGRQRGRLRAAGQRRHRGGRPRPLAPNCSARPGRSRAPRGRAWCTRERCRAPRTTRRRWRRRRPSSPERSCTWSTRRSSLHLRDDRPAQGRGADPRPSSCCTPSA